MHFGPPAAVDDYLQESGRGGRDGALSQSVILHHRTALMGTVMSDEIKQYTKLPDEQCRRKFLLSCYDKSLKPVTQGLVCCDNCSRGYSCCNCALNIICDHLNQNCFCVKWCAIGLFKSLISKIDIPKVAVREEIPDEKISLFTSQLISLKTEHTSLPANIGNIYPSLIENLSDNYIYVSSQEDILELGALCVSDAQAIYEVIDRFSKLL